MNRVALRPEPRQQAREVAALDVLAAKSATRLRAFAHQRYVPLLRTAQLAN